MSSETKGEQARLSNGKELYIGDHVEDLEADEPEPILVVGLPGLSAEEYAFDEETGKTVSDANPDYPKSDAVVEIVYPSRTDTDLDAPRYAFPRNRLRLRNAIHPTEETDAGR